MKTSPQIRFTEEHRVAGDADKIVVWTEGEAEFSFQRWE